jgi:hypothetical protein
LKVSYRAVAVFFWGGDGKLNLGPACGGPLDPAVRIELNNKQEGGRKKEE